MKDVVRLSQKSDSTISSHMVQCLSCVKAPFKEGSAHSFAAWCAAKFPVYLNWRHGADV